jgi:hypothetical protein
LRVLQNTALRIIFELQRGEERKGLKKLSAVRLHNLYTSSNIRPIGILKDEIKVKKR